MMALDVSFLLYSALECKTQGAIGFSWGDIHVTPPQQKCIVVCVSERSERSG